MNVIATAFAALLVARSVAAAEQCQWDISGSWKLKQSNGFSIITKFTQTGTRLQGTAYWTTFEKQKIVFHNGTLEGDLSPQNDLHFVIRWDGGAIGDYTGALKITEEAYLEGETVDRNNPDSRARFRSDSDFGPGTIVCNRPPPPPPAAGETAMKDVATSVGRVKSEGPSGPPLSTCERAAAARDRGSPAAAALVEKCRAEGGQVPPSAGDLKQFATRGAGIAGADPLAGELRRSQPEGARRGFDIGLAASEGQTSWGPGKEQIRDSLPPAESEGFVTAVDFNVDRNRNAERARVGAVIAARDPEVERARGENPDARYRLGFDIASGIFGDPALGAQGNTTTGPGSLGIRDALSAPAQQGFDASVKFHLGRRR